MWRLFLFRGECARTSGAEHKDLRRFLLHRRMIGSRKPSKRACKYQVRNTKYQALLLYRCLNPEHLKLAVSVRFCFSSVCVRRRGVSMAHDHNGRVGPPRCEECNAPLNSDERRSVSELSRSLCVDCYCALYPFPIVKKKRRRLIALRAGSSASSPFEIAMPFEIEPLRRA
jgi:hypothetical protein